MSVTLKELGAFISSGSVPVSSCSSFKGSGFTSRSLTHFKIMFVQNERSVSFSYIWMLLLLSHLLGEATFFFPPKYVLELFVKN